MEEAAAAEDPLVWCGSTATWLIGDLVLAIIGVAAAATRSVEAVGTRQPSHWGRNSKYIPTSIDSFVYYTAFKFDRFCFFTHLTIIYCSSQEFKLLNIFGYV